MSPVICDRHGNDNSGWLVCPHIREASYTDVPKPGISRITESIELADVGVSERFPVFYCHACCATYGLREDVPIDCEHPAGNELAPVCGQCFRAVFGGQS